MVKNTKGKSQLTHDQSDQMTDQWPFWPYDWQIHWPMTILTSWHQFTDQWPFWLDDWQTHWPVTILTRWLTNSLISDHSDQMTDQWPFWPDDWPMTILIRWLISDQSDQMADQWLFWPDNWTVWLHAWRLSRSDDQPVWLAAWRLAGLEDWPKMAAAVEQETDWMSQRVPVQPGLHWQRYWLATCSHSAPFWHRPWLHQSTKLWNTHTTPHQQHLKGDIQGHSRNQGAFGTLRNTLGHLGH